MNESYSKLNLIWIALSTHHDTNIIHAMLTSEINF
jgi:hypothetical protein